jgi:hypothetical protein
MQKDQKFTPKYWVFHDLDTDDIFAITMSKSLEGSKALAKIHKNSAYEEWMEYGEGNYKFAVVEIRLVQSEELPE